LKVDFSNSLYKKIMLVSYIGSASEPDPANSFGSFRIRIRFRIRNTASD